MTVISFTPSMPIRTLATTNEVLTNTEGAGKITELAVCTMSLVEWGNGSLPNSVDNMNSSFRNFTGFVSFVSFIKRFRECVTPDSSGRMLWQRDPITILFCTTLTSYYALSFVRFLNNRRVIQLGRALPIVGAIADIFSGIAGLSDLYNNIKDHDSMIIKQHRATRLASRWNRVTAKVNAVGVEAWQSYAQERTSYWNARQGMGEQRAEERVRKWTQLARCDNQAEIKAYCDAKQEQYRNVADNQRNVIIRTWASVAFDIALVVSVILIFTSGAGLALILANIAVSILEVTAFILDVKLKKKDVQEPTLPFACHAN